MREILLVTIATLISATGFAQRIVPTGSVLYFAHFANGGLPDGSTWKTDFNFVNNSPSLTNGQLQIFNDNGAPFTLGTTMGSGSSFTFTIPAEGSMDIVTDGSGSAAGGWAVGSFDQTVSGSAIYSLFNADGQVVSVGVLGGFPKTTLTSPANGGDGVAIANVDPINKTTSTVTVTATDATGITAGSTTLTLASGHHVAANLIKLIPGLSPFFTGSLRIQSSGPKLQAIVLGFKPNSKLYVAYPQPAISYNTLAASYSGSFTVASGPNAGAMGTTSISNIRYLNSNSVLANFQANIAGNTYQSPMIATADDFGLLYSMYVQVPQFSSPGEGVATINPQNGQLEGSFADLGNGDFGRLTLAPQSSTSSAVLIAGGFASSGNATGSAERYDSSAGAFSATGNMSVARAYDTATLLPTGKVLIAGGVSASAVLNSAELYDPSSGSFTSTGNMSVARLSHTATLLPDGRVLIAGGETPLFPGAPLNVVSFLNSAELYDPSTGIFTPAANMNVARAIDTATLLPSGKVLVAGGFSASGALNSAELYDPSTGTFTSTGSMSVPRYYHTATLLTNGKVLIAGGGTGSGLVNSAELYDPSSGSFTSTGNMSVARLSHTATFLFTGKVLIAGGVSASAVLNSAELYDPSSGSFTSTGNMSVAHSNHTATLLADGKVLVASGSSTGANSLTSTVELYDPDIGTFTATGSLLTGRAIATATLLP